MRGFFVTELRALIATRRIHPAQQSACRPAFPECFSSADLEHALLGRFAGELHRSRRTDQHRPKNVVGTQYEAIYAVFVQANLLGHDPQPARTMHCRSIASCNRLNRC